MCFQNARVIDRDAQGTELLHGSFKKPQNISFNGDGAPAFVCNMANNSLGGLGVGMIVNAHCVAFSATFRAVSAPILRSDPVMMITFSIVLFTCLRAINTPSEHGLVAVLTPPFDGVRCKGVSERLQGFVRALATGVDAGILSM